MGASIKSRRICLPRILALQWNLKVWMSVEKISAFNVTSSGTTTFIWQCHRWYIFRRVTLPRLHTSIWSQLPLCLCIIISFGVDDQKEQYSTYQPRGVCGLTVSSTPGGGERTFHSQHDSVIRTRHLTGKWREVFRLASARSTQRHPDHTTEYLPGYLKKTCWWVKHVTRMTNWKVYRLAVFSPGNRLAWD
jgi:hypothetical protein